MIPFDPTHLDRFGGMQLIPVEPDHEHYPPEPNTLLVNENKSRAYVRAEEWQAIRTGLLKLCRGDNGE